MKGASGIDPAVLKQVFSRVALYLHENQHFKERGLNRTTLAKLLHTNERYLTEAVYLFADGKCLSDYIEQLRLEYACELLEERPEYSIEAIAKESGFGARCSFYRTFRQYAGCSPGDYRKKKQDLHKNDTSSSHE